MEDTLSLDIPNVTRRFSQKKLSKSIETGRVEQGSVSDQKVVTVDKKFEYWAFHTIECKMLPVSQKINTVEDIHVKVYCTNCGSKLSKGHKFCGHCGTKA
jgi:Zn finger protein HypA/HybF involved in hydrogenase expression